MEYIIKVLLQFCEEYCGKNIPSKEIALVLSCLEQEGKLLSPCDILDHQKWDLLTSALAQHAMSAQKADELKTCSLILGALRATREEGKSTEVVCSLLGTEPDPGGGLGRSGERERDPVSRCLEDEKMQPAAAPTVLVAPPSGEDKQRDCESQPTAPSPHSNHQQGTPPPCPTATPQQLLYLLLQNTSVMSKKV